MRRRPVVPSAAPTSAEEGRDHHPQPTSHYNLAEMLRWNFHDFFPANTVHVLDGLGLAFTRHGGIGRRVRLSVIWGFTIMAYSCGAIGREPDWTKYNKALRDVVETRCRDFEKLGVVVNPTMLKYGDEEVVDSFLNGREFYRTPYGKRFPTTEKLDWLKGLLGNAYENRAKAWTKTIEDRKAGRLPHWTPDRLRARLDELALMPESPVKMDDGMCRSSTFGDVARIDARCIHCGRHTVFTDSDKIYHNQPPEYYKRIADEIKEWGLDVEVDGRSACPDCCKEHRDFKLSTTPEVCRVKPDADFSKRDDSTPSIKPGIDMKVIGLRKKEKGGAAYSYEVQCVLPEAWVVDNGCQYVVYAATNDLYCVDFLSYETILEYVEPREVMRTRRGRFSKIRNVFCKRVGVIGIGMKADRVLPVKVVRSSDIEDIPPTYFIINGRRFVIDEFTANALLALVQGYTTFISGYFSDHYPIQRALPKLRECLGFSSTRNQKLETLP